jgi:hypothetical protein
VAAVIIVIIKPAVTNVDTLPLCISHSSAHRVVPLVPFSFHRVFTILTNLYWNCGALEK